MLRKASIGRGFRKGGWCSRTNTFVQRRPLPFRKSAGALFPYHPLSRTIFSPPDHCKQSAPGFSIPACPKAPEGRALRYVSACFFRVQTGAIKERQNTALPAKPHRHVAKRCADGFKRKRCLKFFGGWSHADRRIDGAWTLSKRRMGFRSKIFLCQCEIKSFWT